RPAALRGRAGARPRPRRLGRLAEPAERRRRSARGVARGGVAVPHRARLWHGVERADRAAGNADARAAGGIPLRRLAARAIALVQRQRDLEDVAPASRDAYICLPLAIPRNPNVATPADLRG